MVAQVPKTWKAISRNSTFATIIVAEEGQVAVSMHGMNLALVA
jgi:hypothetical protein